MIDYNKYFKTISYVTISVSQCYIFIVRNITALRAAVPIDKKIDNEINHTMT
jgi:hypothetical protein